MASPHTRFVRFSAALALMLGACEKGLQMRIPGEIRESVPFTPLEVEAGVQTVYLDAFWGDVNNIDSITLSQGFQARWIKGMDSLLLRVSAQCPPLGRMQFWSAGYAYTLPLIRRHLREHTFTLADPDRLFTSVNLITSFANARAMVFQNGTWSLQTRVPEGIQCYGFQPDGAGFLKDPANTDSLYWPGLGLGSLVPANGVHEETNTCRTIAFTGTQVRLSRDPRSLAFLALWDNIEIPVDTAGGVLRLEIPKEAKKAPVSYLRVWSFNESKILGTCKIPLVKGKIPVDTAAIPTELWDAALRYELITDRFSNADSTNDRKRNMGRLLHPKVDFEGGDFAGIANKIRDGYFRELGISFLQISPPARNHEGYQTSAADAEGITASYHGRSPVSASETEPGFGSAGALHQLLQQAQASGLRMGLEPPVRLTEANGAHRLLPADSALVWFRKFNAAAWMQMPTAQEPRYSARTAASIRRFGKDESGRNILLAVDESMSVAPGLPSTRAAAGAYNAPDFYAMAFTIFAFRNGNHSGAESLLKRYIQSLNNLQLRFHATGGEQLPRFISLADGGLNPHEDPVQAGWNRDIQNKGEAYFSRLQSLFALCCALPGIPGMFYGDEIALPGAGAPDNHRPMRFDGLSSVQTDHRDAMARLAKFRRSHPVLMFGSVRVVPSEPGILIIERSYFGRILFVVFNLRDTQAGIEAPSGLSRSFRGNKVQPNGKGVKIRLEPNSYDFIY